MQEEQSTPKADTTTSLHPDVGPYDPDTNPDGYLPIPLWVCSCESIDKPDLWYRRLADRVAGWFS
jgi:hypothetical protein